MSVLNRLHKRFEVQARGRPVDPAEMAELERLAGRPVPREYLELMSEATEVEFLVDGERYLRICGPSFGIEECVRFQRSISSALPIGDDGGGLALVYMDGLRGPGIYLVDFAVRDVAEATYVAKSLTELLVDGVGPEIGS